MKTEANEGGFPVEHSPAENEDMVSPPSSDEDEVGAPLLVEEGALSADEEQHVSTTEEKDVTPPVKEEDVSADKTTVSPSVEEKDVIEEEDRVIAEDVVFSTPSIPSVVKPGDMNLDYNGSPLKEGKGVQRSHHNTQSRARTAKAVYDTNKDEKRSSSGFRQVCALVEKNALTKMRTPWATLAEIISPVLVMVVMVVGYDLSYNYVREAKMFHSLEIDFPPWFLKSSNIHVPPDISMADDFDISDSHRRLQSLWKNNIILNEYIDSGSDYDSIDDTSFEHFLKYVEEYDFASVPQAKDDEEESILDLDEDVYGVEEDEEDADFEITRMLKLRLDNLEESSWSAEKSEKFQNMTDYIQTKTKKKVTSMLKEFMKEKPGDYNDINDFLGALTRGSVHNNLIEARRELNKLMTSPLPTPTFGQFVGLSTAISSMVDADELPFILQDSNYARQWGNLLSLGTIHLSPSTSPMVDEFHGYLNKKYPTMKNYITIRVHDDEETAVQYVLDNLQERTWAVIDLSKLTEGDYENYDDNDIVAPTSQYTIRMNYTTLPNTNLIENYVSVGLSRKYQKYYLSGYLTLQRTVNEFILDYNNCSSSDANPFYAMPMPTAEFHQNVFFMTVGYLMGIGMVMAFLYPTSRLIKSLVEEKETKLKETMFILGIRSWAHSASWLLSSLLTFTITSIILTVMLHANVFKNTAVAYLFCFFFFFSTSLISFCVFVSTFFSRAKLAAIVGPIVLFATLLPRFIFFGTNRYEAVRSKYFASILPGTALAFGADILGDYEYAKVGVQSFNVNDGLYSFGTSISFLIFDTFFYLLLALYLDQVLPRQYGTAKPWHFIFTYPFNSIYKKSVSPKSNHNAETGAYPVFTNGSTSNKSDNDYESVSKVMGDNIEQEDSDLVPRVFIEDLVKSYGRSNKTLDSDGHPRPAVNGLNLTLYESQITTLLGHNGAGKTSTVSVLTGLYPPTAGDVTIYGHSILNELDVARESIGICPQQNILFENLTVMEHLRFFSRIKGIEFKKADLHRQAKEMGLEDYLQTTASALSGGNKRKLSVAIALCGDPKFLILDEPTSAMDPASRRACWDVLRKKRIGRVTLLTTHFMDEADLLSDRVAVLKEGTLQCYGSPLYLKNKFNLGWNMTVVLDKEPSVEGEMKFEEKQHKARAATTRNRITSFFQTFIPDVELVRRAGRELTYSFPKGAEELFASAFDALEAQASDLGISGYGIENASLEELFLVLADEKKHGQMDDASATGISAADTGSTGSVSAGSIDLSSDSSISSTPNSEVEHVDDEAQRQPIGTSKDLEKISHKSSQTLSSELLLKDNYKGLSPLRQIGLLYRKRWIVQKRDVKGFFFTIILPVFCISMVMLILKVKPPFAGPAIEMSPKLYEKSVSNPRFVRETQVVVGGGAAFATDDVDRDGESNIQRVSRYVDEFKSTMAESYPNAEVHRLQDVRSSEDMSHFLLETYNDHDHDVRFGAFVFDDQIPLNVNVDWKSIRQSIKAFKEEVLPEKVDLFELLDLGCYGHVGGKLSWKFSASDMAEKFYEYTSVDPNTGFDSADIRALTYAAVKTIVRESHNMTKAVDYWEDVQRSVSKFNLQDAIHETTDKLKLRRKRISHLISEYIDDIRQGNTAELEEGLNTILAEAFGTNYTTQHLSDESNALIGNMTQIVSEFANALNLRDANLTALERDVNELLIDVFDNNTILEQHFNISDSLSGNVSQVILDFVKDYRRGNMAQLEEDVRSLVAEIFSSDIFNNSNSAFELVNGTYYNLEANISETVSQFVRDIRWNSNTSKLEEDVDAYLTKLIDYGNDWLEEVNNDAETLAANLSQIVSEFFGESRWGEVYELETDFEELLADYKTAAGSWNGASSFIENLRQIAFEFTNDTSWRDASDLESEMKAILADYFDNDDSLVVRTYETITELVMAMLRIDAKELEADIEDLVNGIFDSGFEVVDSNTYKWRGNDIEELFVEFMGGLRQVGKENYYEAVEFGKSVNNLAVNLNEHIKQIVNDTLSDNNLTDASVRNSIGRLIDEFLTGTDQVAKEASADYDQITDLADNVTQMVSDTLLTNNMTLGSFGDDMDVLVQDFLNGMREIVDEDAAKSDYDLVMNLAENITQLVSEELVANNLTASSIKDGIHNLRAAVLSKKVQALSKRDEALKNTFGGEDMFNRYVIEREFSSLISGLSEIFGTNFVENPTEAVEAVMLKLDGMASKLNNGNAESRVPGKVVVTPLMVLDTILSMQRDVSLNAKQVFGYLSELLGGSKSKLDGFISVKISSVVVDLKSMSLEWGGLQVATADATILDVDDMVFKASLDKLDSIMPDSEVTYTFDLYSRASLLHNASSAHAVAAFSQAHMERGYKQCKNDESARLVSVNHPLPLTTMQSLEIKVMLSVLASLCILIPYCYIPAAFVVFLVKERVSKSKHLQLVSGVNMSSYWLAAYLWDLSLFFILTCLILIIFMLYGDTAEVFIGDKESFMCTAALTFGYGLSVLPFSYLLTRKSGNHSSAQIKVAGLVWLTGFVTINTYLILNEIVETRHIAQKLKFLFRLFPAHNLGEGLLMMSTAFWEREILGEEKSPFEWDVAGRSIVLIYALALPYYFLVLVLEYADDGGSGGMLGKLIRAIGNGLNNIALRWYGVRSGGDGSLQFENASDNSGAKRNENSPVDEDVSQEYSFVLENKDGLRDSASVLLVNLWKIYPPSVGLFGSLVASVRRLIKLACCCCSSTRNSTDASEDDDDEEDKFRPRQAVRGTTTAITKGETYALLGANGAGKTTTIGMLTGDICATSGEAYVTGCDVTGNNGNGVTQARQNIGFCPQVDPLIDLMTGRETLTMFARLRGVPENLIPHAVEELLHRLTLTPHADKVSSAYSGGNKRKLSLGMALIGDPKVLLIDESSSGLDPVARRRMWDLIEQAARDRCVILTTHSMQEAEALSTRVAIMSKGQFVCLGSIQHLKTKYLDGCSIDIFCENGTPDEEVDKVLAEVLYFALPGSRLSERHGRFLRFEVSNVSSLGLGTCFRRLQELKKSTGLRVENYSIAQCSLEQVFIKLMKNDSSETASSEQHTFAEF